MTPEDRKRLNYWSGEMSSLARAVKLASLEPLQDNPAHTFERDGHAQQYSLAEQERVIKCLLQNLPHIQTLLEQRTRELDALFKVHYGEHYSSNPDNPIQECHEAHRKLLARREAIRRDRLREDTQAAVQAQLARVLAGQAIAGEQRLLKAQQALLEAGELICDECGHAASACPC